MKFVLFILLVVLVGGGAAVAMFPMSMAAEYAAKHAPDFRYASASGSIWDGKLTQVSYGEQDIGDLAVKADLGKLLSGMAGGKIGLTREGFDGEAGVAYPLMGGRFLLNDVRLSGKAGMVPGMPQTVAAGGGDFVLEVHDLAFEQDACSGASGQVWTNALAKVNWKGWIGPELRGPVTCENGRIRVLASGTAETGEEVQASMDISPHLDIKMTAAVLNAHGQALQALTDAGFVQEGNALVIRQEIGPQ